MKHYEFRRPLLWLLTFWLLLLPLSSCSVGETLAYRTDDNQSGNICEVYAKGERATRVRVTDRDGKELFDKRIKVDRQVGRRGGSFGFEILDLNFDGLNDWKLITDINGEMQYEACYLQTADGGYEYARALEGLANIHPDPEQKTLLTFSQAKESKLAPGAEHESYINTDTVTGYTWKEGKLVPYRRVSYAYHSEQNIYIYSVSDYNEALGEFLDPDDNYLSPEEYAAADLSFFYYFR